MIMCNAFRGNAMDLRAEISFRLFQFARSVVVQFFFGYRNDVRIGFE